MKSRRILITLLTVFILSVMGGMTVDAAENEETAVTNDESTLEINIPELTEPGTENEEEQEGAEIIAKVLKTRESALEQQKKVVGKERNVLKRTVLKKQTALEKQTVLKKNKVSYTKAELRLMSAIIYCEAGNEPYAGKLGVGIVVMNRKASRAFPNTVKGVVYQRGQFSPSWNGTLNRALAQYDAGTFNSTNEKACVKAAKEVLAGTKSVDYAGNTRSLKNYYYFSGYVRGCKLQIGGHQYK